MRQLGPIHPLVTRALLDRGYDPHRLDRHQPGDRDVQHLAGIQSHENEISRRRGSERHCSQCIDRGCGVRDGAGAGGEAGIADRTYRLFRAATGGRSAAVPGNRASIIQDERPEAGQH